MEEKLIYEKETYAIRGAIFEVYKTLGDGYLEEVYQNALEEELKLRGVPFVAKKQLHIYTANRRVTFGWGFSPRNARKHTEHDSQIPHAADLKFSPVSVIDL